MNHHWTIDQRGREFAELIVKRIDDDPERRSLAKARKVCERWLTTSDSPAVREWWDILQGPWSSIKSVLLDSSDKGNRLRQSSPFCGIIPHKERWDIIRKYKDAKK